MAFTLKQLAKETVTFLTREEVKNSSRLEYNPREWRKAVDMYKDENAVFFQTKNGNIYVVYMNDGIRFLNEINYTTSLSSSNFAWGYLTKEGFVVYRYEEGRLEDNSTNRECMKRESLADYFGDKKFFTKTF